MTAGFRLSSPIKLNDVDVAEYAIISIRARPILVYPVSANPSDGGTCHDLPTLNAYQRRGDVIGEWGMIVVANRNAFGMSCVRCRSHLMAPVRSTYKHDHIVSNDWYCECCDLTFSTSTRFRSEAQVRVFETPARDEQVAA